MKLNMSNITARPNSLSAILHRKVGHRWRQRKRKLPQSPCHQWHHTPARSFHMGPRTHPIWVLEATIPDQVTIQRMRRQLQMKFQLWRSKRLLRRYSKISGKLWLTGEKTIQTKDWPHAQPTLMFSRIWCVSTRARFTRNWNCPTRNASNTDWSFKWQRDQRGASVFSQRRPFVSE